MADEVATIEYLREQVRSISRLAAEARDERDQALADLAAARAEVERLDSWDGLLSILDEHYPAEVFEKSADLGARIVTLTRHLAAAREREGSWYGLVLRMAPLVNHSERLGCPMAFHRSDGEQCTCGALEAVEDARAALAREAQP